MPRAVTARPSPSGFGVFTRAFESENRLFDGSWLTMSLQSRMDTGQIYSNSLKICHEIVGYPLAFAQFNLSFISLWTRTSLDRYPFVELTKLATRCSDSFGGGNQIWMTSGEDAEWLDRLSTRATPERLDNQRHGPLNTLFLARIRTGLLR